MNARFAGRHVLLAMGLITVSFVFATMLVQRALGRLDRAAAEIAEDASPSIEHLAAARGEIREVQSQLDEYLDDLERGERVSPTREEASRRLLDAELATYFRLPPFPEEDLTWAEARRRWDAFDEAVARVTDRAAQGSVFEARAMQRERVGTTADALTESVMTLVELNARHARALAGEVVTMRHRTQSLAFALTVACVCVAGAAFGFVERARKRESSLVEANAKLLRERADELENFAGRVAHDILSPLGGVKLALAMIGRREQDADVLAMAARADRGVTRATAVVRGLLAFASAGARPEPGRCADVATVMQGVMEDVGAEAAEAGVALDVVVQGEPVAACSEGVFMALVSNLTRNAIKHMGAAQRRRVAVTVNRRDDRVRVEVLDTGPGVPEALQSAIFEPFVRVEATRPGIGLGLATVRRLVSNHGGAVGLRSAVGSGSTFWFELPAADASALAKSPPSPKHWAS